jgi:Flp pilus assembly secretin CpaC
VILSGSVMNAADSGQGLAHRQPVRRQAEDKVLNMLSIAGKDQVMLEVRIVEVQRNVIKQLGVDTERGARPAGPDPVQLRHVADLRRQRQPARRREGRLFGWTAPRLR